jgi:hypothetical protein
MVSFVTTAVPILGDAGVRDASSGRNQDEGFG